MARAPVACALILLAMPALAQTSQSPTRVVAQVAEAPNRGVAGGYYVEFRVASIGTYGHSYAVYGPTRGRPSYADSHPMGGYAVMALGHVFPVPANTEWNPEVLSLPVASRYRRSLNATQYKKLLATVRALRAKGGYWNAITNNCNHFIGELAAAVGLRVPGSFQVSYSFVPALRALNEGERPTARGSKPARDTQTPRS
jgi:hypothetical protein